MVIQNFYVKKLGKDGFVNQFSFLHRGQMSEKEFLLRTPDLGDTEKIDLVRWSFAIGDLIQEGDEVIELVTDKAAFPVESPYKGILKEIRISAGNVVKKGDILGVLEIKE